MHEKHHILPKCFKLGGDKDQFNLVKLTPREHFICHKLLVRCINDKVMKSKLTYAVWQLTRRFAISSREYEYLKTQLSETYTGIPKTEEHKANLRKPKTDSSKMGRPKGCRNPSKGTKRNPKVGENISLAKKGKNVGSDNHFYGKHHSKESIQKMRQTVKEKFGENPPWLTKEAIAKRAKSLRNNIPHNAKQVVYKGVCYPSLRKCAEANGVSSYIMNKLLQSQQDGVYRFA